MSLLNKLKKFVKRQLARLPSRLPQGMAEFDAWVADIVATYDDLPTTDLDSLKFVLSTVIMHIGPTEANKSKAYFVSHLRTAAAKQVAGNVFHEIKTKQKEAQAKAAQEQAEATAAQASSDGPQQ